jgi:hypothetical protein
VDRHAEVLARLRVTPHERPGKDHAVVRVVAGGDDPRRIQLGDDLARLGAVDHPRRDPVLLLQRHRLRQLLGALLAAGEEEVPALAEPDVDPHLGGEVLAEPDRVLHQTHVGLARPLRPHPAAVAPGGAAAEVALLDHDDPLHAELGQVPRRGQPHDPTTDDDDVGLVGERRRRAHRGSSSSSISAARCASGTGWKGGRGVIG